MGVAFRFGQVEKFQGRTVVTWHNKVTVLIAPESYT